MAKIPGSVLALLKNEWRPADDHSSFDSVFNDPDDRGRKSDPSFYFISNGKEVESDMDTFSHAEIVAVARDGALGSMAAVRKDGVSINEHAQHALSDFCSDVYAAWAKYQSRLADVERTGRRPRD